MSVFSWIALLLLLAAGCGFAFWVYHRRELPVAGRRLLALARALAISLVLLLIWNPRLPAGAGAGTGGDATVLLDGSLSMAARSPSGESAWSRAVREAAGIAGADGSVLVFGGAVTVSTPGQLDDRPPAAPTSRLLPALRAAAESGARAVTVVSDGRLTDADFGALPGVAGVQARLELVDVGAANAGIADLALPARAERGAALAAEVTVFGEVPAGGASARIEVREEGRLVASAPVDIPSPGEVARTPVDLPATATEGLVRYTATVLLDGDGFPDDDQRVRYVHVAPPQAGLVLLSLRPDWEPRYLLPVLEDVTGLPARGYLRVAGPRYLPLGRGEEVSDEVTEADVRALLAGAEVVVLHGVDARAPTWVPQAARDAPRLLIFPADRAGASLGGVEVAGGVQGEWYVVSDLPASPLAGEFVGIDLGALPPLTAIHPVTESSGAVALQVQLGGRGPGEAALVLTTEEGRRRGVALAAGYWRWAARDGAPRRAYRALWAGVANWLFAGERLAGAGPPGPAELVVPRARPVAWEAPGLGGQVVGLRLTRDGEVVFDSAVVVDSTETFVTPPLDPGTYDFAISPAAGGEAGGRFDVEGYTADLRLPAIDDLSSGDLAAAGERPGATRPLRTHPAPFLVILAVLCGEWIGRRRQGLR